MLAILLEGTRQLHRYYEKEAGMCHIKARDDYPPVLQLVNPRSSLTVAVLQYLSSLIGSSSACTRLCLVFAIRGVRTFADWKRLWPADVELLSNAVLLMSASLERRQRHRSMCPFHVFHIALWCFPTLGSTYPVGPLLGQKWAESY